MSIAGSGPKKFKRQTKIEREKIKSGIINIGESTLAEFQPMRWLLGPGESRNRSDRNHPGGLVGRAA